MTTAACQVPLAQSVLDKQVTNGWDKKKVVSHISKQKADTKTGRSESLSSSAEVGEGAR